VDINQTLILTTRDVSVGASKITCSNYPKAKKNFSNKLVEILS